MAEALGQAATRAALCRPQFSKALSAFCLGTVAYRAEPAHVTTRLRR
jgi:hypothetical protein